MLNAEVHALVEDLATNALGDGNTNSALGDVPNGTGLAVVVLVRETLVDSTITLNIDDIANLVDGLNTAEGNSAGLAEVLLEEVARTGAVTKRVRHG